MRIAAILIFFVSLYQTSSGQTGKVTILIKGINAKKGGLITAGIFEKDNFPKAGKHVLGMSKEATEQDMALTFESVSPGEYAVAVFLDEDRNNKLTTNFIGIPTEALGFSNDAKIKFGPPSFAKAKFIVESGKHLNLIINLGFVIH